MYSRTLNLLDNDSESIGKFILNGGTVNISRNTAVSSLVLNSGIINITEWQILSHTVRERKCYVDIRIIW